MTTTGHRLAQTNGFRLPTEKGAGRSVGSIFRVAFSRWLLPQWRSCVGGGCGRNWWAIAQNTVVCSRGGLYHQKCHSVCSVRASARNVRILLKRAPPSRLSFMNELHHAPSAEGARVCACDTGQPIDGELSGLALLRRSALVGSV